MAEAPVSELQSSHASLAEEPRIVHLFLFVQSCRIEKTPSSRELLRVSLQELASHVLPQVSTLSDAQDRL